MFIDAYSQPISTLRRKCMGRDRNTVRHGICSGNTLNSIQQNRKVLRSQPGQVLKSKPTQRPRAFWSPVANVSYFRIIKSHPPGSPGAMLDFISNDLIRTHETDHFKMCNFLMCKFIFNDQATHSAAIPPLCQRSRGGGVWNSKAQKWDSS